MEQGDHQKPSESGWVQDGGRGATKGTEVEVAGQDFIQQGSWLHRQDLESWGER